MGTRGLRGKLGGYSGYLEEVGCVADAIQSFEKSKVRGEMSVIGIDYGNLDCVIAQAKRGGIDIVLNENSNRKNRYVAMDLKPRNVRQL